MPGKVCTNVGQEPSMFLQRPSTAKSQDVRHILTKTFRQLYTRDAIRTETVKNLQVSKGSDDPYHERYVESLQKIYEEWQRRMDEAAMLETHIMQAQARATSADERELNRIAQSCDAYKTLGLPPSRSHFSVCIDSTLLKKHNLLTPDDYGMAERVATNPPSAPRIPSYERETLTSQQHSLINSGIIETPLPDLNDMYNKDMSFITDEELETIPELYTEHKTKWDAWKKQMNEEQREIERRDLANLQAKVHYLRNPRCVPSTASFVPQTLVKPLKKKPKEIGIQDKQPAIKPQEPVPIFQPSPPVIVFTNYSVGEVYETILELKNVSSVLRQCRVLPLSTPYFAVGLGQFPGEHGLVAPGMSCKYPVRFVPDSLGNYEDNILIQTQSSKPLIVTVKACREPPSLAMPPVLDLGCCLVGGCNVTQYVVINKGGPGRFCILSSSSWPATNFRSVITNGAVHIQPFDIKPSSFELVKGQTGVIEVLFKPFGEKEYTQDLVLVCDNCQVKHFSLKGKGETAKVELSSVERGLSSHNIGELHDRTAENFIRFDELNPFTYTDRSIVVKNCTNVELPFQWMVYKPQMQPPDDQGRDRCEDRIPDLETVFSVHPPNGILSPNASMDFKATFAPPVLGEFHNVIHMMLQNIPHIRESISSTKSDGQYSVTSERRSSLGSESRSSHLSERRSSLVSERRPSLSSDEDGSSEMISTNDVVQYRDVTGLEIEVKGTAVPPNIILHPYAIYVPGTNLVGTTIKKLFTMANHSFSVITFQWEPHNERHIIEVEPPSGELDPGMALDLELGMTGVEPGKISTTLYCHIMNMNEPLALHVEFEVKGPEISIVEPDINFGLVRLGQTVTKEITLINQSQVISTWNISNCPVHIEDLTEDPLAVSEFNFSPSFGELKPLERKVVIISFHPHSSKSVKRIFEIHAEKGNKCCIDCYAEVQSPTVCLMECTLNPIDVYVGVPHSVDVVLYNQGLLPTQFQWGKAEGIHAVDCSIKMDQEYGLLGPREKKVIKLTFCATREGHFSEVQMPCTIEGMHYPLFLSLSCYVKGLSVSLKVSVDGTEDCDDLHVDFGNNVPLGSTPKRFIHIKNQSAILAPFTIEMEYFTARLPTPPEQQKTDNSPSRKRILDRTPNIADPQSKTSSRAQADLQKAMLIQGRGAAFLTTPPSGYLEPFTEQVIEVTAFSDMWGEYRDNAVIKVGHLDEISVPVTMAVFGCPLKFQMFAAKPELQPIVRYGTHVAGVPPVRRKVRVNNISPYDIRLDWVMFNIDCSDNKLLDLNICYGRPFPLKDEKGNIVVVEPGDEPKPVVCVSSDHIPNSDDTSPEASRSDQTNGNQNLTEEEKRSKPKRLITLYLRQHLGVKSTTPYSIEPEQLIIGARSHAIVNVILTPFPASDVSQEIDCLAYALGYMSIDGVAEEIPGKVVRKEAFETQTLRLEMTSHLKPALLIIEHAEEDGMIYQSAMSDLLTENNTIKPESIKTCTTMLLNNTEAPVTFKLKVKEPFWIVDLDPNTSKSGLTQTTETNMYTLKPQYHLQVKVGMKVTKDLLVNFDSYDNETDTKLEKMEFHENLQVEFNNNTSQTVPLYATVAVPEFELSKTLLDFGTCLVGQEREMQFCIINNTASHSYWTAHIESKSESCTPEVFTLTPSSGLLEANITHVTNSKQLIKVHFTAKHAEFYEIVFLFSGYFGETTKRLMIKGTGSYDGKYMAVINI